MSVSWIIIVVLLNFLKYCGYWMSSPLLEHPTSVVTTLEGLQFILAFSYRKFVSVFDLFFLSYNNKLLVRVFFFFFKVTNS